LLVHALINFPFLRNTTPLCQIKIKPFLNCDAKRHCKKLIA
jgi:hypothetical protein